MEPAQLAIQSMQSGSCSAPITTVPPCCRAMASAGAALSAALESALAELLDVLLGEFDEHPASTSALAVNPAINAAPSRTGRGEELGRLMRSSLNICAEIELPAGPMPKPNTREAKRKRKGL